MIDSLAVMFYPYSVFFTTLLTAYILVYLLFTQLYSITLVYIIWLCFFKSKIEDEGGPTDVKFRKWSMFKKYRDYFPCLLVKTCDLDSTRNYLMCAHPHGILGFGIALNLATEASKFSQLFPSLTPHLMTLSLFFKFPIARAIILRLGVCSSSHKCIEHVLNNKGAWHRKGQVAILVVGGVAEMRQSHPDHIKLVLKDRRGFAKMALKTGADLVPVFSFGENEVYDEHLTTLVKSNNNKSIVLKLDRVLGVKTLTSRRFWLRLGAELMAQIKYSVRIFTTLPKRVPLTTVVGAPIRVTQINEPTKEQIDKLHAEYIVALTQLYETHKSVYATNSNKDLNLEII